jgi:glutathione synthase/RimK-type ligase-like ATP-grasp enzyme
MKKFAQVRTKNYTSNPLRRSIITDRSTVIRLGSITPTEQAFRKPKNPKDIIEINTVEAINNSRNKLLMKSCFSEGKILQSEWWSSHQALTHDIDGIPFPLVVKRVYGFQGRGMELIEDMDSLNTWINLHPTWENTGWYFEKFYNYAREYRLHVSRSGGVFLSWRKLRTKEATNRWFFNSTNSNWVSEDHELFDRPKCWDKMKEAALNALVYTKLDIGAVDIRVQSNKQDDPRFIVCEINSAPALGEVGINKYKEELSNLIKIK